MHQDTFFICRQPSFITSPSSNLTFTTLHEHITQHPTSNIHSEHSVGAFHAKDLPKRLSVLEHDVTGFFILITGI
jgi:hypothetical protein